MSEVEARRLNLREDGGDRKIKVVNYTTLPITRVVKKPMVKFEDWSRPAHYVTIKMDKFVVVPGMKFLLEYNVLPIPLIKCLVITGLCQQFCIQKSNN